MDEITKRKIATPKKPAVFCTTCGERIKDDSPYYEICGDEIKLCWHCYMGYNKIKEK